MASKAKEDDSSKENAPKPVKGIMIHSDGSARPNPGFTGWGMHGYIFEDVEPTKGTGNPDYVLTAKDYLSKAEKALNPNAKIVTPLQYVDGWGSFTEALTNNYGELCGACEALELALEQDAMLVTLRTDSEYVCKNLQFAFNWRKNNWTKSDGRPPGNVELWKRLLTAYESLKAKGAQVSLEWNRGHNGNFGNEIADVLAYIGMRHSSNGIEKKEIKLTDAQGYWKYETNRHAFFNHRRMYFNSQIEHFATGEYYFGEHGTDDDMCGKRMADGAFSLVRMKQPDPALEALRRYTCDIANGVNSIMLARLDYLYRSDIHKQITQWGPLTMMRPRSDRLDLEGHDEEPLMKELREPIIAQRAIDAIRALGMTLDDYLAKEHYLTVTDLTPILYETTIEKKKDVEKRITKLRAEFKVGYADLPADILFKRPDGTLDQVNIKLALGIDMLDRNALRRLEDDEPVVKVVTWSEDPQAFRHATIIETKDGIGIWAGYFSNLRIILPKKADPA